MKTIPLIILTILSLKARSQEKESFYVFDADWKPTKMESARYFLHTKQVNDSCWKWDYYHFMGPLVKTERYRNKDGKELDGESCYYDQKGFIDSMATYRRGKKNGNSWRTIGDSSKIRMSYRFINDSLVEVIDPTKSKKDSTISYKDEKESEFPGGSKGWTRYLMKNLRYPERAVKAVMQGQVVVQFIVDKDGTLISPFIYQSVEYSIDEEAMKIITNSGKWEPAFQNGHNVKSYKHQPIVFRLE